MVRLIAPLLLLILVACTPRGYIISGNVETETRLLETGSLSEILERYDLPAEYVLLVASDGIAVLLSEPSFPYVLIVAAGKGFDSRSEHLPPVTNLKSITEIAVYNSDYPLQDSQTPFSLRLRDFELLGESSRNGHFVRKLRLRDSR